MTVYFSRQTMDRFRFQETSIFKKPADLMQMFRVRMFFLTM